MNGSIRRELLGAYLIDSKSAVKSLSEEFRQDYNAERPHKALGFLSHQKYTEQCFKNNQNEKTNEYLKQLI